MIPTEEFDVFLSHGSPDKPWVETLASELKALGLKPFYDLDVLDPADNFPLILSHGLARSRFLVLILSPRSDRPWVRQEWAAFMAHHGPEGRLVPVLLESTEVPALLAAVQRIDATDRDAARVAREIALLAGRPAELPKGDARRLVLGQELLFSVAMDGIDLRVTDPTGKTRMAVPPWRMNNRFALDLHFYDRLTREPVTTDSDRADLFRRATSLGSLLFDILFDEDGRERLQQARVPGKPRPLITIRSEDDVLLSFPWELLCQDGSFLLRDARIDLARSTPGAVGAEALLREPDGFLKLVVNVSAPEGSGLDYEGESYRITKALSERCRFVPTELGTVEDLVETVRVENPTAIHFSGHGSPGSLAFEDDEGRADAIAIHDLLHKLRTRIDGPLPPLFFLASCHGNDLGGEKAETSAACLHREGVPQVVGYYGPIIDELSTRAEVAFYRALAEGETTRYAVRQAREALAAPFGDTSARHRPRAVAEPEKEVRSRESDTGHSHPFAWAQLVLYHRGPDHPLSLPAAQGLRQPEAALRRTFTGVGDRRVLTTGFIGRRSEMHQVRRRIRRGDRVLVLQGLGGLGKSTLAFHVLPMLQRGEGEILALWCQEVEQQPNRLEGLVGQLLDHCRKRFGLNWEQVVYEVDRAVGDDPLQRFPLFLQALLQRVPRLVLYLDNLESLQVGPRDSEAEGNTEAIGVWASEDLGRLWEMLADAAQEAENLYVVASCRYRSPDFGSSLLPVSPLPPDALFRLMSWFPALRRLSSASRARLTDRLAGHPRAVEYADDLVAHALREREGHYGPWKGGEPESEWSALVEPVLPKVQDKLQANLLLAEIWERVLADRERRMLYRMTLLRRPWQWALIAVLGEEGEADEAVSATADLLRRTSLLEEVDLWQVESSEPASVRHFMLHPSTIQFVRGRFEEDDALRRTLHRRVGDYMAETAESLPDVNLEAGYHLLGAGEYERAFDSISTASDWLQDHGRAREVWSAMEPFFDERAMMALDVQQVGKLLNTVTIVVSRLGDLEAALEFGEQSRVLAREIGNPQGESSALMNLGIAHLNLGNMEKAVLYLEDALAINRKIGQRKGEAGALGNLGATYEMLGTSEKAIGYFAQQLEISREIIDRRGEMVALGNLGVAYAKSGRLDGSIGFFEQSLLIAREIGDCESEAGILGNLGIFHAELGKVEEALAYLEKVVVIARTSGDRQMESGVLGNIGIVYARLGETDQAIPLLEQAIAIGQEIKNPHLVQLFSVVIHDLRSAL